MASVLCAAAIATAVSSQAAAQGGESGGGDTGARDEFVAGREAFNRGDFEEAVRRFEHAFELSGRSSLLFNVGAAYERLHRWEQARGAYQRYLREVPDAPDRADVQSRLRRIDEDIARWNASRQSPRIVLREVRDPPHTWRVIGFATGGLAVVGTAVTIVLAVVSQSFYDGLVRDCAAGNCPTQSVVDDLALREGMINGLIVASSVGAAFSVASFIIDAATWRPAPRGDESQPSSPRGRLRESPTVRFSLTPPALGTGFGLTIGGRF